MKKLLVSVVGLIILGGGLFYFLNSQKTEKLPDSNQAVLEKTMSVSKQYVALRYRTDNLLLNAKNYPDYIAWNNELTVIMTDWMILEDEIAALDDLAKEMVATNNELSLIPTALAYDKQEISNIFDNAPAGKKIATLAKHLGVDAKLAYKILQQDQAQVEADAWTEAGDTFQKLETSATLIKDGCKVAGFVGSIALTGGTSALAAGSTLAKTVVVVTGADLTLEVTDDAAKIALGNHNKISAVVGTVRTVTEPIATILTISDIPNNLSKNLDKFNAAMTALDQFRGAAQEGKIIGVELPVYTKDKADAPAKVAVMQREELEQWLSDNNIKADLDDQASIEQLLDIVKEQYAEMKTTEIKTETPAEATSTEAEIKEEGIIETEVKEEVITLASPVVETSSGLLSLVSPSGNSFTPVSGLSFAVKVSDPESLMAAGKNLPVWCRWNFTMEGQPSIERINPSIIHAGTVNVCEYSTLLIKQKGKLRVEFNLERGTTSKYSDEKNVQLLDKVQREYIVK